MRILFVSHPPVEAELGAAQVAVNLAQAMAARGHETEVWSPEPQLRAAGCRRWDRWRAQQAAIERYASERGTFDLIDVPAISVTPRLARQARIVARSVQPELHYLAHDLGAQLRALSPRLPLAAAHHLQAGVAVLRGWRHAAVIMAQGCLERHWLEHRLPRRLAARVAQTVVAPSPREQEALAAVRRQREAGEAPPDPGRRPGRGGAGGQGGCGGHGACGRRFLWIGRWSAQKGVARLVRFLRRQRAGAARHGATQSGDRDTFTIAGCGAAAARALPAEWLHDGMVRLVPHFERHELPALLADHDCGLFTSDVEGWGLSLNEMLEAGLTVYATERGGVPDLRPYWRSRLQAFPPPRGAAASAASAGQEPDVAGYYRHFSWPAIAQHYEEVVGA